MRRIVFTATSLALAFAGAACTKRRFNHQAALESVDPAIDCARDHPELDTIAKTPLKAGVYYGSFDPPTHGHLRIIRAALETYGLERVYVYANIAANDKDFRAGASERKRMLELGTREFQGEVVTGAVSPHCKGFLTASLKGIHGNVTNLIGADSMEKINRRYIEESGQNWLVFERDGDLPDLVGLTNAKTHRFEGDTAEYSSTLVRDAILKGTPTDALLHPKVDSYIRENMLYFPPAATLSKVHEAVFEGLLRDFTAALQKMSTLPLTGPLDAKWNSTQSRIGLLDKFERVVVGNPALRAVPHQDKRYAARSALASLNNHVFISKRAVELRGSLSPASPGAATLEPASVFAQAKFYQLTTEGGGVSESIEAYPLVSLIDGADLGLAARVGAGGNIELIDVPRR